MADMVKKIEHLKMVQGVINRMASNSFLLKGWSVVLVSALFALAASGSKICFIYLAYFPAIAFWVLDGYYLWQEKLFRKFYDQVRVTDEERIDFSLNTEDIVKEVDSWIETIWSKTLLIFYGAIIIAILIVMGIMIFK